MGNGKCARDNFHKEQSISILRTCPFLDFPNLSAKKGKKGKMTR